MIDKLESIKEFDIKLELKEIEKWNNDILDAIKEGNPFTIARFVTVAMLRYGKLLGIIHQLQSIKKES